MPDRTYEFVQLDVFTQTPLMGNPLAIFTDARGLDDDEMQALAREMNLSETTFILPRDPATETQEGKKVRIFTVAEELPFAGHPIPRRFTESFRRGRRETAREARALPRRERQKRSPRRECLWRDAPT